MTVILALALGPLAGCGRWPERGEVDRLIEAGSFDAARSLIDAGIAAHPNDPQPSLLKGKLHLARLDQAVLDPDAATEAFRHAILMAPETREQVATTYAWALRRALKRPEAPDLIAEWGAAAVIQHPPIAPELTTMVVNEAQQRSEVAATELAEPKRAAAPIRMLDFLANVIGPAHEPSRLRLAQAADQMYRRYADAGLDGEAILAVLLVGKLQPDRRSALATKLIETLVHWSRAGERQPENRSALATFAARAVQWQPALHDTEAVLWLSRVAGAEGRQACRGAVDYLDRHPAGTFATDARILLDPGKDRFETTILPLWESWNALGTSEDRAALESPLISFVRDHRNPCQAEAPSYQQALTMLERLRPRVAETRAEGRGMTWSVLSNRSHEGRSYVSVGRDQKTNPYQGDTPTSARLPILAWHRIEGTAPPFVPRNQFGGWSGGEVRLTQPVVGHELHSLEAANRLIRDQLGAGWRMAEFHDGRGWSLWARGELPSDTRFWVYINDQRANPWDHARSVPTAAPTTPRPASAARGEPPGTPLDPVHVGGDVKAPRKLSTLLPQYNEEARVARIQGVVIVQAIIDTQGRVTRTKVLKGLPNGLSEAATKAIAKWRFEPATVLGRPVAVYYNLTVNFRLE